MNPNCSENECHRPRRSKNPRSAHGYLCDIHYTKWYRKTFPDKVSSSKKVWVSNNKERALTSWNKGKIKRRRAYREWLNDYKLSTGCMDCGYNKHPAALDFDHREDEEKLFQLSYGSNKSHQAVLDEIAKCDIVCANCHRIRTAERLVNA